uniref:Uncharacterized protein n=1 Tax=Caenorhabditis japonica TaxID=281687 RepID=A0A8R1IJP4_CAEJA
MDTPPGSLMTLEVTVMYRTKNSLAFRVNGCDILGFMSDGLPPMAHQNSLGPGTSNNNNKSKKNDDGKDGRSNSANSNGRSTRGGSVVDSKNEKHRKDGKRKKEEVIENDYVDEDSQGTEERKAQLELVELES